MAHETRHMNTNFPVAGVLAVGQQHYGSAQLNIKSEKRKARSHIVAPPGFATGRTPFVVTSESPGPSEYKYQPDPAFVHPSEWGGLQNKLPLLPPASPKDRSVKFPESGGSSASNRSLKSQSRDRKAEQNSKKSKAANEARVVAKKGSPPKSQDGDTPASLEQSSSVSGEDGRAVTDTGGEGTAASDLREVANGNQQPSKADAVEVKAKSNEVEPLNQTQSTANANDKQVTQVQAQADDVEDEDDEEDDNGWSGDESSEDEGGAKQKGNDGGSGSGAMPGMSAQTWSLQELEKMWLQYDNNNSGQISFAEIEKVVVEQYPEFDNKEVLMRAYKFADEDNSGLITKGEFVTLLRALTFFQNLWTVFSEIDVDGDESMSLDEFIVNRHLLGLKTLNLEEATELFHQIDDDHSGNVRFFELCSHLARKKAQSQDASDARAAAREAKRKAKEDALKHRVEVRNMTLLARQPGSRVPIAAVGRDTTFKTLYSGFTTLETVVSPGPAYDVSGSFIKKQFNKQKKSGATFGTGQRFMPASRNDGPGPGKYNGREANYDLAKNERDGGAAKLLTSEARTMLSDNARRTWGASKHHNGAFFPPDADYFTRPSPHASCANPVSSLKSARSPHVHGFAKATRPANAPVAVEAMSEEEKKKRKEEAAAAAAIASKPQSNPDGSIASPFQNDPPWPSHVLSTQPTAPSSSFGSGPRLGDRDLGGRGGGLAGALGPGPQAYDTVQGSLSSVGVSTAQRLPGHGAPAFSFGGNQIARNSMPVINARHGIVYGPAARVPYASEAEAASAALRGLGYVSSANATPGVGAYNIDLGAALDAVLANGRRARQFPNSSTSATSTSAAAMGRATTAAAAGAAENGSGAPFLHDSQRFTPLAVQQGRVAPAMSFAVTGRTDFSKLFPGGESFMPKGAFTPNTPGHFYKPFPAPLANSAPGAISPGAFSFGGNGVDRSSSSHVANNTDAFPDARFSILDSIAGEQPKASPYASVPVYSMPKATRTDSAVGGLRTNAHAVQGDNSGSAARLENEAIYADYRGGSKQAALLQTRERAAAAAKRAADEAEGLRKAAPPLPRFATARDRFGGESHGDKAQDPNSSSSVTLSSPLPPSPSSTLQGGGGHEMTMKHTSRSPASPSSAPSPTPGSGYFGAEVPDRLWPRESPGPAAHDPLGALEALELGGVPSRQRGVKLTLAKRFAPQTRLDGSIVEHPYEKMHADEVESKNEAKRRRNQQKVMAASAAANGSTNGSATHNKTNKNTKNSTTMKASTTKGSTSGAGGANTKVGSANFQARQQQKSQAVARN